MNFLVLGTPFLLFMLNYDWPVSYLIKLVGAVLILVGLIELKNDIKDQDKLKTLTVCYTIVCGASTAGTFVLRMIVDMGNKVEAVPLAAKLICLILWAAAVLVSVYIMDMLYKLLDKNRELLSDTVNLVKLGDTLKKLYFVTVFTYVSNLIYMLLPYRQTADFFAVLMIIGKLVLYVLIIISTVRFFRLRTDYYSHTADDEE